VEAPGQVVEQRAPGDLLPAPVPLQKRLPAHEQNGPFAGVAQVVPLPGSQPQDAEAHAHLGMPPADLSDGRVARRKRFLLPNQPAHREPNIADTAAPCQETAAARPQPAATSRAISIIAV
jgi:hypothetical protein